MKKLAVLALALVLLPQAAFADARPVSVYMNGINITEGTETLKPILRDDRNYLPLRAVAEDMGMKVDWNAEKRVVTVGEKERGITMTIGKKTYTKAGKAVQMDVAPFIEADRTYVPMRFVAEGMDIPVDWDKEQRMAVVGSYAKKTDFDEADRVQAEGYSYILPKAWRDRIVVTKKGNDLVFYDKVNSTDGFGRIGQMQVEKDPVQIPVPTILLGKAEGGYRVFTFASDVQVKDIEDKTLTESYATARADVQELLKTYRAE
ncbi:Copper amine oxidase N-terminal domain [Aedoeadaptatus ivorii]|uniref:Copper amine oxidase N-terminal domain n=1 Tax=Aedoeadaptatus ivorii TaxID=54006 RepID=A0A448UZC7_9FIRM|nr:copper amine oxidase N-terminal domain-containing protein [Peptoniphilus ivorii]VEJ34271.1 Copper amine oxidase N-terminal domain [Peptoniphilus ivorii]